jgi:iron complex outermembrane receptor protein
LIQIEPFEILLSADEGEELEEVVITSTRSSRTIDNIPTKLKPFRANWKKRK